MAELLNVAKLVDRAAPPSEDRRAKWLRRCQLWSVAGILPTAVSQPASEGRRRRLYRTETIWLAAVLLRLSDLGLETSLIEIISSVIQEQTRSRRQRFGRFWHETIEGSRATAYILFSLKDKANIYYNEGGEGLDIFGDLCDAPTVVLNLATVFEEVRSAAKA
jgi:hypothetical protein